MAPLSPSAQRVQDSLARLGLACTVLELPASTRTAAEAAQAVGCDVNQIVKSLVFRGATSNRPIMVVASGANRVGETRLAELAGEPIARADPEFVREHTGFAIGGVAPLGHPTQLDIFVDQDLFQCDTIWAAAGTPRALFQLTPADLVLITAGQVVRITDA